MINLLIALLITILVHEFGHLIVALLCKVRVTAFSIGFGKPYLHKKIGKIDFRISPWLIGSYTKLAGERDKTPNGFLAQPYKKKVYILLAGAGMNLLVAFICYLINYRSISLGIAADWLFIKSILEKDAVSVFMLLEILRPNIFLAQLGIMNFYGAVLNLLPFPALDGGYLWIPFLEGRVKNYPQTVEKLCRYGFAVLMVAQGLLIWYLWS